MSKYRTNEDTQPNNQNASNNIISLAFQIDEDEKDCQNFIY